MVAKKNLPKKVRAWVKNFQGKDLVYGYRKHFHASWSCAVIELRIMGVPIPDEDIEEAKRRQIGSVIAHRARKAKRAEARRARELAAQERQALLAEARMASDESYIESLCNDIDGTYESDEDDFGEDLDSESGADWPDDFDPFAD